MIDLDILVSAKRTELTKIFPGYSREQLRDMRTRELRRRSLKRSRDMARDNDKHFDDQWMEGARRGSERLLAAIRIAGVAVV